MDREEKIKIIELRIVKELRQHQEQHFTGFPMQMLAAKYSKAISNGCGSFPEFIESMRQRGLIQVAYSEHGARTVFLGASKTETKVWF